MKDGAARDTESASNEGLSELQLAVMRIIWEKGEASATEVHSHLGAERDLAPTTVATILSRLEKRGVLHYRKEGRQHIYRATVSEKDVRRSMVGTLVQSLFRGNPAALVSHLLAERSIRPEELETLQKLLTEKGEPHD